METKRYLVPAEVAELLMVSPVTVRQWAQRGLIKAMTTAGGHRRFSMEAVEGFAKERGLTLNLPKVGPLRVLLVESNERQAGILREQLELHLPNTQVVVARDAFDAGYLVHTFQPRYTVLDLENTELDNYEICRRIKTNPRTKAVEVIATSGISQIDSRRLIEAGALCCLQQPIEPARLINLLRAAADQSHNVSVA